MAVSQYAVTTLAAAKEWLKIAEEDASKDSLLETLINAVSEAAENYTGRYFVRRGVADEPHDCCEESITLDYYPVESVSRIMLDGAEISPADCQVDLRAGIIKRPGGFLGAALVSYRAGYADDSSSCPQSVQLSALRWISSLLNRDDQSVSEESLGDYSVSYFESAQAIPPDVRAMLDLFRERTV